MYATTSPVIAGCAYLADIGNCEFYICADNAVPCGDHGYALGYGYRYCNRFSEYYNKFTADVSETKLLSHGKGYGARIKTAIFYFLS